MTEIIDNARPVTMSERCHFVPIASMVLPCLVTACGHTRLGGFPRIPSQESSKGPPLMPEMPETPNAVHRVAETLEIRAKAVVDDVAVWATRKCAGSRTKRSAKQVVSPIDRRHDGASKLVAA